MAITNAQIVETLVNIHNAATNDRAKAAVTRRGFVEHIYAELRKEAGRPINFVRVSGPLLSNRRYNKIVEQFNKKK